jgi:DNA-binding response OmpR family regulator
MLHKKGYQTIESSNPGEAILISENKDINFALLITDVFMPLMNGRQLSERLHTMGNQFQTIFISGHDNNTVKTTGIDINSKQFLPKPFQRDDLLAIVRLTLDGRVD